MQPFSAGRAHSVRRRPPPHVARGSDRAREREAPSPDPPTDADFVKLGAREPDWDLDPGDPALDYVERYIHAVLRYKNDHTCVHAQPSRVENGRTLVDTRDTPDTGDGKCKGSNAVRDTFAVDVEHDHLELADPAVGAALADWPDGSGPGGMPAPSPKEGPPIDQWRSALPKAFQELELVPLRVQFYGRGSYPVISIAGWHGVVKPATPPTELKGVAEKLCHASAGFPLGVFTTGDRTTLLRIKCPNFVRWERL